MWYLTAGPEGIIDLMTPIRPHESDGTDTSDSAARVNGQADSVKVEYIDLVRGERRKNITYETSYEPLSCLVY